MEAWKPVPDFEQSYQVSDAGKVQRISRRTRKLTLEQMEYVKQRAGSRSQHDLARELGCSQMCISDVVTGRFDKPKEPKTLSPGTSTSGYLFVVLCADGKKSKKDIHRLVAEVFIGPPLGLCVNHKDGDKVNNHVSNLEYVTYAENNRHSREVLGNTFKLNRADAIAIRARKGTAPHSALAKEYGVTRGMITAIMNHRVWK
jgi:hypothetical protein